MFRTHRSIREKKDFFPFLPELVLADFIGLFIESLNLVAKIIKVCLTFAVKTNKTKNVGTQRSYQESYSQ